MKPHSLLVGLQAGAATMETNVENLTSLFLSWAHPEDITSTEIAHPC